MISLKDATAAAKAFTEARDGNVVDVETLKTRASICVNCPMKQLIKLTPRDQASKVLGLMANKHRVPDALKRYRCGVCRCALMLLTPALPEHLHRDNPEEAEVRAKRAPNCWLPGAVASVGQ